MSVPFDGKGGKRMKDTFSGCHPAVNFTYFAAVILCSMFFLHPVFLGISLVCSVAYSLYLNGGRALRFNLLFMLPAFLLFAFVNPFFNHEGVTALLYINDNAVTLEAIAYGPQPYRILYRGHTFKVTDYDDYLEQHRTVKLVGDLYV